MQIVLFLLGIVGLFVYGAVKNGQADAMPDRQRGRVLAATTTGLGLATLLAGVGSRWLDVNEMFILALLVVLIGVISSGVAALVDLGRAPGDVLYRLLTVAGIALAVIAIGPVIAR